MLDSQALQAAEHQDGKFVVHGNDGTLTAEGMTLGYKQLQHGERAWRDLKSGLDLRPVFCWARHGIHAHVAITLPALLLERTASRSMIAVNCFLPGMAAPSLSTSKPVYRKRRLETVS
jgi:hypothetical protein